LEGGVLAPVETGGVFFNKEGFEDKGGEGKWDKTETPEGMKLKTHFSLLSLSLNVSERK
jgi:hypothetical protein